MIAPALIAAKPSGGGGAANGMVDGDGDDMVDGDGNNMVFE